MLLNVVLLPIAQLDPVVLGVVLLVSNVPLSDGALGTLPDMHQVGVVRPCPELLLDVVLVSAVQLGHFALGVVLLVLDVPLSDAVVGPLPDLDLVGVVLPYPSCCSTSCR